MTNNLTMLTDLYQLTMMNGYYKKGLHENTAVFDIFLGKMSARADIQLSVVLRKW